MVPLYTLCEYDTVLRTSERPVLVQLEADWCGNCHEALPELQRIAERHADRLTVLRVDADRERSLQDRYQLEGYPTYLFAERGRITASCLGAPDFGLGRLVDLLLP